MPLFIGSEVFTRRFHAKHLARFCAEEHAEATGRATGVYLDSLGFLVCEVDVMHRIDCALVFEAPGV